MDKILHINYQGRSLPIEELAYQQFQSYEQRLQTYFSGEEGGEEIFADLQYRMAEILEQAAQGKPALEIQDIDRLKEAIGQPEDFGAEADSAPEAGKMPRERRTLHRNSRDKIIAGVCSGIANYFSIDPIAVRLIFVIVTVFNVATLFALNLGILAYILFWIVLKPKALDPNISRKLFRNPKDKILGGVCSGLAQFFNTEAWIVRLIFLAPLLLGVMGNRAFDHLPGHFFGDAFFSITFISYFVLWFITPVAKATTDYMLLKGEPINLNTIRHADSEEEVAARGQSGLSKFLRIVAYFLLALLLIVLVPTVIGIFAALIYSYSLADLVLFSSQNKILAVMTGIGFVVAPALGVIIWMVRKVAGYRTPNRPLRLMFISLHILGWISAMILVVSMGQRYNTYAEVKEELQPPAGISSLYITSTDTSHIRTTPVFVELNQINRLLLRGQDQHRIRAVRVETEESADSLFHVVIEKSAVSSGREKSAALAARAEFHASLQGDTLLIDPWVGFPASEPYHFEHVTVTVYYPRGTRVITSGVLKQQLNLHFSAGRQGLYLESHEQDDEVAADEITGEPLPDSVLRVSDHQADTEQQQEALREARERLEEARRAEKELLQERERELENARRELERDRKAAEREREAAERELERVRHADQAR